LCMVAGLVVSEGKNRSRARLTASVRVAKNAFKSKGGAELRRAVTGMRRVLGKALACGKPIRWAKDR